MAAVRYAKATRIYPGNSVPALNSFDLEIADGEFMVLVGPSGSGKSTALRMLAGLEDVDEGEIYIGDQEVSRYAPKDRDIAMVFQNYALYPHLSVADNMAFALRLKGVPRRTRHAKVLEAAELLDLVPYLNRKPKALSGGQRQRVAMGRAIVREPSVFLMDEPLSNLDAKLRVETRANIAALQARLGTTTVYVTHDQIEAMTMGHRVALLKDGVLQQVATPRMMYDRPVNVFVAGFIGSPAMNLRRVVVTHEAALLGNAVLAFPLSARTEGRSEVVVGLRPEALDIVTSDAHGAMPMQVSLVEQLGADSYVHGVLATDNAATDKPFIVRVDGRHGAQRGERVYVSARGVVEHVFDLESGDRIG